MALPAQMPLRGSASAPKFDGKTPSLLPRFLEDVDILGTAATLTDAEKVRTSIRYADLEESEGWELLPEAIVVPADWAAFALAVKALYPGCEGANRYCQADLQYLVQEYRAKPMRTLADFGEYKRKFMKITQFLINGQFLSELDCDAYFPKGLPTDLETQVRYRLLITNTAHHPSNPYVSDSGHCRGGPVSLNGRHAPTACFLLSHCLHSGATLLPSMGLASPPLS